MYTYVILNGLSNQALKGFDFADNAVFGCNYAYRDWPLTHLVCADARVVEEVNNETKQFMNRYTKLPRYRTWGWQTQSWPGNDSGSYAIDLALNLYNNKVIVAGADGIFGFGHQTSYTYSWRPAGPRPKVYDNFRVSFYKAVVGRTDQILFLTPRSIESDLPTQTYKEFLDEYKTNVY